MAKLSGPAFLLWQKSKKGKGKQPLRRLCTQCFIGVEIGKSHTCSASTLVAVENLVESLPEDVRAKLAHQYLASKMESAGDSQPIFLPPAGGEHPVPILFSKKDIPAAGLDPLTHEEVIAMRTEAQVLKKNCGA